MTDTITLPRSKVKEILRALRTFDAGAMIKAEQMFVTALAQQADCTKTGVCVKSGLYCPTTKQAEQEWVRVPVEPTEEMWSGLARDIVFWLYMNSGPHYGSKMHEHLRNLGTEIPDWLLKEIPDTDSTPPKGTVAVVIYKAMLAAAPKGGV